MRRTSLIAATVAAAVLALADYSGSATSTDASTLASPAGEAYLVGITQITAHTTLDSVREGFKKAFEDAGIQVKYDEQNAQGDQATATSIASKFASSDLDLVLAIMTPSAQATAQSITRVPILFTAVTDPVSARLVNSLEAPGSSITGATSIGPVTDQISLVKEFAPKAEILSVIYSSDEANSGAQVELAKRATAENGLQIIGSMVTNSAEVQQAAQDLASKVDTIYVPTDNTVVSALASAVQAAENAEIPLVAGEANSAAQGALATYGIDYSEFGCQIGEMAIRILKKGAEPASLPVETQKDYELTVSATTLKTLGLKLPASLKNRTITIR